MPNGRYSFYFILLYSVVTVGEGWERLERAGCFWKVPKTPNSRLPFLNMYRRPGYGYGTAGSRSGYRTYGGGGGGVGGYGRGQRDRSGLAMSLLISLLQQVSALEHKPPATMLLLAVNVAVFFAHLTDVRGACIMPSVMVGDPGEFVWRTCAAAFTHADEVHLYYNMSSLIFKGYHLERRGRYSSRQLLFLVLELVMTSSLLYCLLAAAVPFLDLYGSCAVGFSAVLFGLKVVLHDVEGSQGRQGRQGDALQTASWAELLLGQFFSMQYGGMTSLGSAVGHGCGVLAGLVHCKVTRRLLYR